MTRLLADEFEQALAWDAEDPLGPLRDAFHIPVDSQGRDVCYLVGNSLGLQPRLAAAYVQAELTKWQRLGVRGHFEGEHPWMPYHRLLSEPMARLVGARADEVVVMNSLTVNLHLMLATFYRFSAGRHKILMEPRPFPSDRIAVESFLRVQGRDPGESLVWLSDPDHERPLSPDAVHAAICRHGPETAIVLLPGVQYYTGERFDIRALTDLGHEQGAIVGWDLAHAVGNVPLALHDHHVDFAVWCSYKYLNSGPGSVGGCFLHERHARRTDLPRLAGWWGHEEATRFRMTGEFHPIPTAEGWQLSNPPILSLAAIRASLDTFDQTQGMDVLRTKSLRLTGWLAELLHDHLGDRIEILTPSDPEARGCQLSLRLCHCSQSARWVADRLAEEGVLVDHREPHVIRVAPVPLYNRLSDVLRFVAALTTVLPND